MFFTKTYDSQNIFRGVQLSYAFNIGYNLRKDILSEHHKSLDLHVWRTLKSDIEKKNIIFGFRMVPNTEFERIANCFQKCAEKHPGVCNITSKDDVMSLSCL